MWKCHKILQRTQNDTKSSFFFDWLPKIHYVQTLMCKSFLTLHATGNKMTIITQKTQLVAKELFALK